MGLRKNIIAFFVIGIIGTLSHFTYKWTGENVIIGLFTPVNESVWEHLKLLFYPTIFYSIFEYLLSKEKPCNYLQASTAAVICGMTSIVALFYITTGIIGRNIDFLNIMIYFISIIIMLSKKQKYINRKKFDTKLFFKLFAADLLIMIILFSVWSYNPLSLGIFTPPIISR